MGWPPNLAGRAERPPAALSAVLNFDYLGEYSHWGNLGRVAQPISDENLRYITPRTSLVNEAPPMPLRTSSHPGNPNSSCSALAWYSYWTGLSPWGESWKRTRVAHTAALTRYRYATKPTLTVSMGGECQLTGQMPADRLKVAHT